MHTSWWQQHWHSPIIASNNHGKQHTLFLWLLCTISTGVSIYFLISQPTFLLDHYRSNNYQHIHYKEAAIILTPFCIAVLLFIIATVRICKNIKNKKITLVLDTFPTHVGNAFLGNIELDNHKQKNSFCAELVLHKYTVNPQKIKSGKNKSEATTKTLWRMPITVNKKNDDTKTHLSLEARLPDNAPPSSPSTLDEYHEWQLHVFTKNQKFTHTWNIPIVDKIEA
jgi:hypothetical protein